jgi:two-component system, NtrC family, sensor histidine kinase HydH
MALNRRILVQVTMPAVLIGLALLGTCVVGIHTLNHLEANRDHLLSRSVSNLQAALELQVSLRRLRTHSFLFVMDPSSARRETIEQIHQEFEQALENVRKSIDSPAERVLIEAIETGYRRYREELTRARLSLPERPSVADYLRWADAHPSQPLLEPCQELLKFDQQAIAAATRESADISLKARNILLLLGLLGPVGGLVGGFGVAWGLSRSITRLSVRLKDVHAHLEQDLGAVRLAAEGDLRHLDRQLEQILDRVRHVVAQVQEKEREVLRSEQLAAVGQLAAGVAHEVRNPLASIKLLVGAALNGGPGRRLSTEDLRVIHAQVGQLEHRVQALLDFARPPEVNKRLCDLRQLITQSLDLVRGRIQQQNVEVDLNLPADNVMVHVDRDQLTSVLVNLLLNALDAMPGGGRLGIELRQESAEKVRLDISDTGGGIDPTLAGRLFSPFVSTKPTGTGLGLSISRRVVADHGGTLTGVNRAEGGACFTITLLGSSVVVAAER